MLSQQKSLHDEFVRLLQDIYHAVKFENANYTKVSAIAKNFEEKIREISSVESLIT